MTYQLPGITSPKDLRPNTPLTCGVTCGNQKPHLITRLSNRCTQNKSPHDIHTPNWASQPHIPVEDDQGQGHQKTRGKEGASIRPKDAQRKQSCYPKKR